MSYAIEALFFRLYYFTRFKAGSFIIKLMNDTPTHINIHIQKTLYLAILNFFNFFLLYLATTLCDHDLSTECYIKPGSIERSSIHQYIKTISKLLILGALILLAAV
jgi:hypothetical protein